MAEEYLIFTDVDKVQSWLMRSLRIRDIAGASQILSDYDKFLPQLISRCSGETLYAGGGTSLGLFPTENHAREYSKLAASELRKRTINASMTASDPVQKIDSQSLRDAVLKAVRDVQMRKRAGTNNGETADMCLAVRCEGCGLEPAWEKGQVRIGDDERWLGEACHKRHVERDRLCWLQELAQRPNWNNIGAKVLPYDVSELSGEHQLAVIMADIDGVGQRLQELETKDEFKDFSKGLERSLKAALHRAIESLVKPESSKTWKLPLEILYAGGDDLLIACRSSLALNLVLEIAREFKESFKDSAWCNNRALGISFGIAIVNPKFPFKTAQEIANGLLKNAKRTARAEGWAEGAVDWAVITESWADACTIIADRSISSSNRSLDLTGRPYRASGGNSRTLSAFKYSCERLSKSFPRNRLFEMRLWSHRAHYLQRTDRSDDHAVNLASETLERRLRELLTRAGRDEKTRVEWEEACRSLELDSKTGFFLQGNDKQTPVGDFADSMELWGLS